METRARVSSTEFGRERHGPATDAFWGRSGEGQQTEGQTECSTLNRMIHLGKPDSYRLEIRS
ncbi:MAG: hypothetical protein QGG39_05935 [Candidatus Poribacteria bacterium]|nr:hypothetical protein [Candidatus Poribacteria bacterium]